MVVLPSRCSATLAAAALVLGAAGQSKAEWSFRWLGQLGGDYGSCAYAVSADGSLVVGRSNFGAFLWDDAHGMRDLNKLLVGGGLNLQGGTLTSARDVSFDGQTIVIVGEGWGSDGSWEAWMAVIPEPSSLAALASMAAAGLVAHVWRRHRHRKTAAELGWRFPKETDFRETSFSSNLHIR